MKIAVYTIALNEERNVDGYCQAAKDADYICILDTGSKDNTENILRTYENTIVQRKVISPWRFDVARNESLKLIPDDTDVCLVVDLDERLSPGWRKEIEDNWKVGYHTRGKYTRVSCRDEDKKPTSWFMLGWIHDPKLYRWTYPVHEVLSPIDGVEEHTIALPNIELDHYKKVKETRDKYLPLLELGVQEMPDDPRACHYLAREYMYKERYTDAIREFKRYLTLEKAVWKPERCATLRYLSDCYIKYKKYGDLNVALDYAMKAVEEFPSRESYNQVEKVFYLMECWDKVIEYGEKCITYTEASTSFNELEAWGATPYDCLTIAYWHMGRIDDAIIVCKIALSKDPKNKRIKNNLRALEYNVKPIS